MAFSSTFRGPHQTEMKPDETRIMTSEQTLKPSVDLALITRSSTGQMFLKGYAVHTPVLKIFQSAIPKVHQKRALLTVMVRTRSNVNLTWTELSGYPVRGSTYLSARTWTCEKSWSLIPLNSSTKRFSAEAPKSRKPYLLLRGLPPVHQRLYFPCPIFRLHGLLVTVLPG